MKEDRTAQLLKSRPYAKSLTHVLDQSERVKEIVEECADAPMTDAVVEGSP
jgi:hypothetical protein